MPARALLAVLLLIPLTATAADVTPTVTVDASREIGCLRPLHGGSDVPIQSGGLVDLSAAYRELALPLVRLHDCRWPAADIVDMHAVFPNPAADPASPASYTFARTDACIDALVKTGAKVVYRLGESIEHTPRQYFVHPPADIDHFAAQCVGIVRHYNEGWADGAHHGIQYWEVWNEPENRPRCWTGTDDQYFALYAATARAIKTRWHTLKVGGPAVGYTGKVVDGRFEPGDFVVSFLKFCRDRSVPLDFFSWHLYTNDAAEYAVRARGLRDLLDRTSFKATELHLNEWNYLPDNQWIALDATTQGPPRDRYFARATGPEGAAFAAAVLTTLQDTPVDAANFFATNTQPLGLFNEHGTPRKAFYAFKAFARLLETPVRLETRVDGGRLHACAGTDANRSRVAILVSSTDPAHTSIRLALDRLPWTGPSACAISFVDGDHDFAPVRSRRLSDGESAVDLRLSGPCVALVVLTKDNQNH